MTPCRPQGPQVLQGLRQISGQLGHYNVNASILDTSELEQSQIKCK